MLWLAASGTSNREQQQGLGVWDSIPSDCLQEPELQPLTWLEEVQDPIGLVDPSLAAEEEAHPKEVPKLELNLAPARLSNAFPGSAHAPTHAASQDVQGIHLQVARRLMLVSDLRSKPRRA